ncbi:glycosyltransferase family 2 protein [Brevundimonas sp. 2R-24]|uniref:Glycosyltransferase family 2 protein n=1 Tax=Peiella sedimenti TaxID=3061083 RepID=A0ABT8SN15_9CAUL|nr:glycosyltransferase family 2 protein [Caulobacteraceae bacterium XZ-24]
MLEVRLLGPAPGPPERQGAAMRAFTLGQAATVALFVGGAITLGVADFDLLTTVIHRTLWWGFLIGCLWRLACLALSASSRHPEPPPASRLPFYSLLVAVRHEAAMAAQLIDHLRAIDYPPDRIEALILVEADDPETMEAMLRAGPPPWMQVRIVPPGAPRTKPRALNHGLGWCRGELVVVYDAEDRPDPLQLREAAARFAASDQRLACLQAPLRIRPSAGLVGRQFRAEYAALFESALPALARLRMPLPLGGTSNHFRREALEAVRGWDPYNVTEDADMAFRLYAHGYRIGMISRPTWESPPEDLSAWLPQRARWLKGFVQTLGVHTREPSRLGVRGMTALLLTLGQTTATALAYALALAWAAAALLTSLLAGVVPMIPPTDLALLVFGYVTAITISVTACRRIGVAYDLRDALLAPAYWCLMTVAMVHALWQLGRKPFHWDKTEHRPDLPPSVDGVGLRRLDESGAAAYLGVDHA